MSGPSGLIRVLIVDDESPARAKLRRWVTEQPDLELVAEAQNGLAAAQLIASARPDLVFLDIQMPDMSGLEVAAQLRACRRLIVDDENADQPAGAGHGKVTLARTPPAGSSTTESIAASAYSNRSRSRQLAMPTPPSCGVGVPSLEPEL